MTLSDRAELKRKARSALDGAGYSHRKFVLLHTGGILVVNLVVSLLIAAIGNQVNESVGLGGMQTRAFWSTLENLLLAIIPLVILFWDASYYHISMGFARGNQMLPKDLLAGFRRPISVLGCSLLPGLHYLARGILCTLLASVLFSMSPFAQPLMDLVQQLPTQLVNGELMYVLDEATQELIAQQAAPMMIMCFVLFIPIAAPVFYRYRLSMYLLLDDKERDALSALRGSRWRMQGRKVELFRLDLSFWWYYLLQLAVTAVCYIDFWLPMLGIQLPVNGPVLAIAAYLVYAVCQLTLDFLAKNQVQTTYAIAYDTILSAVETPQQSKEI